MKRNERAAGLIIWSEASRCLGPAAAYYYIHCTSPPPPNADKKPPSPPPVPPSDGRKVPNFRNVCVSYHASRFSIISATNSVCYVLLRMVDHMSQKFQMQHLDLGLSKGVCCSFFSFALLPTTTVSKRVANKYSAKVWYLAWNTSHS